MENILISGSSPVRYRVAEEWVRSRVDEGRAVILLDFEWRNQLLPEVPKAELASLMGFLNRDELTGVYREMAEAYHLHVNTAAMSRFLGYVWDFYRDHQERLTIEELRTLNLADLKDQVRQGGTTEFLRFLENHETRMSDVEDAIVYLSEELRGDPPEEIGPEMKLKLSPPVDEDSAEARAFVKLLPSMLGQLIRELNQCGETPLCVFQGTPYRASALLAELTALPGAEWLVISGDLFGIQAEYQSEVLSRMDKCMVYCHVLESSAAKWAAKIGVHRVRRAAVTSEAPGGMFGRTSGRLMTPRNSGMTGSLPMGRSRVTVTTEECPIIRPDEIVRLGPEECICLNQRTGEYIRF